VIHLVARFHQEHGFEGYPKVQYSTKLLDLITLLARIIVTAQHLRRIFIAVSNRLMSWHITILTISMISLISRTRRTIAEIRFTILRLSTYLATTPLKYTGKTININSITCVDPLRLCISSFLKWISFVLQSSYTIGCTFLSRPADFGVTSSPYAALVGLRGIKKNLSSSCPSYRGKLSRNAFLGVL
jgi:hypothetical protein